MNAVELKNITKRFDDKLAVDNVSLNIEKGELYGLIGPNGAGKTTLISMICGLTSIDSGEIKVSGYPVVKQALEAKKKIGLVPQDIALYESLSAIDNLQFWGRMYGLKGKLLKERMDEILETTELKDRAKEKVSHYSGGMKRRLNIACAVMHHPEIIIMDEPTVGIDPQSRNHILEFTRMLNRENGSTVIYTSHYMEEVEQLCTKVAIIDNGKIITSGTQDEIKKMVMNEEKIEINVSNYSPETGLKLNKLSKVRGVDYKDSKLIIVMKNSEANLQDIIKLLFLDNVKIRDISIKTPNLETVFLSLTGKSLRE